jgi:translation elongation factor EF-Tu-like GTPase
MPQTREHVLLARQYQTLVVDRSGDLRPAQAVAVLVLIYQH